MCTIFLGTAWSKPYYVLESSECFETKFAFGGLAVLEYDGDQVGLKYHVCTVA